VKMSPAAPPLVHVNMHCRTAVERLMRNLGIRGVVRGKKVIMYSP
jgi:hypothetical protein